MHEPPTTHTITDFIRWALTHAKRETIPAGADLVLPRESCGAEPWQYLYGSVRVKTTQATLDLYYNNHYSKKMSRTQYDAITAAWDRNGYATDCQGLLDAWFTYEQGEKTDINANMNYLSWCSDKGEIAKLDRPYVIGEALFMANSSGKMTHVGWVCGFAEDGGALVVEARGIAYGVVVTHINSRPWTHRGLMTAKFSYNAANEPQQEVIMEPIVLKKTSPMIKSDGVRLMQQALNALGYRDAQGRPLDEDGKCGSCTMQAVTAFANAHAEQKPATELPDVPEPVPPDVPEPVQPAVPEPVQPAVPEPVQPAVPEGCGAYEPLAVFDSVGGEYSLRLFKS